MEIDEKLVKRIAEAIRENISDIYNVNILPDYENMTIKFSAGIDYMYMDELEFLKDIKVEIAGTQDKAEKYSYLIDRFFEKIVKKIMDGVEEMAKKLGLEIDRDKGYIEVYSKEIRLPEEAFRVAGDTYKPFIIEKIASEIREYFLNNPGVWEELKQELEKIKRVADFIDEEFYSEHAWRVKHLTIPMLMRIKEEIESREVHMIYPTKIKKTKSGTFTLYIPSKIVETALQKEKIEEDEILVQLKCENGAIRINILHY